MADEHAAQPDRDVHVALSLSGELDPDVIKSRLGLSPTGQFSAGEVINSRRGRVRSQSAWLLESTPAVTADAIGPHLDWLLDLIEPRSTEIAALVEAGVVAKVDCFWASIGLGGGPWISPTSMMRLGTLGLPLVISFYSVETS